MSMLGMKPEIPPIEDKGLCYSKCHFYVSGGRLCEIRGLDELLKERIIDEFLPTSPMGVQKNPPSSSGDRIGCVFITANDYFELQQKVETAVSRIQAIDENGNDMLIKSMYLGQPPYFIC